MKQVQLWFYKLSAAGLAAVRKIQIDTILEKIEKNQFADKTSLNIQNRTKKSSKPPLQRCGEKAKNSRKLATLVVAG